MAKRARLDKLEARPSSDWEELEVLDGLNEVRFFRLFNVSERAYIHVLCVQVPHLSPPPIDPASSSPPAMSTRTGRRLRIPKKLDDMVPSSRNALPSQYAPILPPPLPIPQLSPARPPPSSSAEEEQEEFETPTDAFGVFRCYFRKLQQMPEDDSVLEAVCDAPGLEGSNATNERGYESIFWLLRNVAVSVDAKGPDYGPFANASQFRLFDYFYDRSEVRSHDAFDDLLHLLRSDNFSVDDLEGFSARKGDRALEDWVGRPGSVFSKEDGWLHSSVTIALPPPKRDPSASEETAATFEVTGIIHRSLRPLLEAAVQDTASRRPNGHHWVPHEMHWVPFGSEGSSSSTPSPSPSSHSTPPGPTPIRVYTDCYNTDAMLEADAEVRNKPRHEDDDDEVENVVLPLLLWSDATHLSSFGAALLWPIYLYFGNLSKYIRGHPTEFAGHHLAYIPDASTQFLCCQLSSLIISQLPDSLKDEYIKAYGQAPTADVLTFCKRELFNKVWLLILDEAFLEMYEHGVNMKCGDGVVCRIFPRFFTYSADYPEKCALFFFRMCLLTC